MRPIYTCGGCQLPYSSISTNGFIRSTCPRCNPGATENIPVYRWLETNCHAFKMQHPCHTNEDHVQVIGLRSDFRVFYAYVNVPEHPRARPEAYKAMLHKFDSFLLEDPQTATYTTDEYRYLVDKFVRERKAISIELADLDLDKPVSLTR